MDSANADKLLLQEANGKVQSLMVELYATRRELWDTQQTLNQAVSQRDSAGKRIQELEQANAQLVGAAQRATAYNNARKQLQEQLDGLQLEVQSLRDRVSKLSEELESERQLRKKAEEAKTWAEAERARLQRSKDELAMKLKVSERRQKEAEEEQVRAEQELSAAHYELRLAQQRGVDSGLQPSTPSQANAQMEDDQHRSATLLVKLDAEKARNAQLSLELTELSKRLKQVEEAAAANRAAEAVPRSGSASDMLPALGVAGAAPAALPRADGAAEEPHALVEQLQVKVMSLKNSRGSLLAQLDAQQAELDRLTNENTALQEGLRSAEDVCGSWQRQLEAALAQQELLKDLLEESASWAAAHSSGGQAQGRGSGDDGHGGGTEGLPAGMAEKLEALEQQVLQEQARSADLMLQVQAPCAELTKATQTNAELNQALLPLLNGVGARLESIVRLGSIAAAA